MSEIENWLVRQKESKYGNYENLYLTLNSKKIVKLKSYDYDDFYEVRSVITRNKPQNKILKDQLDKKESLRLAIFCTLLGLLFIYIAAQFYKDASLTKNDVSIIKAKLSDDIKLKRHKRSKSLICTLENFNEFEFTIGSLAIKETYYRDLMNDLKKGNLISLTIEKDQYQKKISKKTPMSILDKYFHYEKIDVVEAESKDFKYLSLSDYNKVNRQNDYWGIGFFGLFGVCLLIGVFFYLKKEKPFSKNQLLYTSSNQLKK
ncbi:hypothetical protein L1276_002484 [Flavobacterium sp. HSC-32F16]|uniref:hypothetical protein n=1 Tax=Flavobacterium sp. HSC-32F16 TaxID=2910964 RepID=UPI0020A3291B|nr:hypothetical protein [Flavobacterium sp. HSC-32F16]MCP2027327.1 hypothetical protein [Flavobacterium sp. HSC-32F16]